MTTLNRFIKNINLENISSGYAKFYFAFISREIMLKGRYV